mgnify:CR=1 FL=1
MLLKGCLLLLGLFVSGLHAGDFPRELTTQYSSDKIKVDGKLDEAAWKEAAIADSFYIYDPEIGVLSDFRSEVRTLYTDRAFYVGARLYDHAPDSILKELTIRNNRNGNADAFMVEINAYNDHQNAFLFYVTAANVQSDVRLSGNSEDESWNAVWLSETSIDSLGWTVELLIPYSALRIPQQVNQAWGINFRRLVRRTREFSSWNPINKETGEVTVQAGILRGISHIKHPLRLAFFPYLSGYLQKTPQHSKMDETLAGGMDVKYGVNESFTLDMTLIPDFGQTITDQIVLNLSPYEIYYNENRAFFNEGTELFNKQGLFYSRRIGKRPMYAGKVNSLLEEGETVELNPSEGKLLNATKFSGRMSNGLGLGVFNAMTDRSYATVRNSQDETRKILTDPFTNFNILVMDQAMRNNSYINLINTNVYRPEIDSIANVTGLGLRLMDASNRLGIEFQSALSYKTGQAIERASKGYYLNGRVGKFNGRYNYHYYWDILSDRYDPNDMAYLAYNNMILQGLEGNYRKYTPGRYLLSINTSAGVGYQQVFSTGNYSLLEFYQSGVLTFKNYLSLGWNHSLWPLGYHDYFEPRVANRYYRHPERYRLTGWISSDYRKALAIDIQMGFTDDVRFTTNYYLSFSPRIRVNNHLFLVPRIHWNRSFGEVGYVSHFSEQEIILGIRNNSSLTNSLGASYVFNNEAAIRIDFRHLNNLVDYRSFQELQPNGDIETFVGEAFDTQNQDINYNVFSIDWVFSWNFAPGSFLNLVWKNFILPESHPTVNTDYWTNLRNTVMADQSNSLSFKLIYYVDYQFFQL